MHVRRARAVIAALLSPEEAAPVAVELIEDFDYREQRNGLRRGDQAKASPLAAS
jgi:hypothetical protein